MLNKIEQEMQEIKDQLSILYEAKPTTRDKMRIRAGKITKLSSKIVGLEKSKKWG